MIRVGFLINFNYLKWLGGAYVIKNLNITNHVYEIIYLTKIEQNKL